MPVFSVPDLYFLLGFRSPSESEVSQMITTPQQSSVLPGAQACLPMSTSGDRTGVPGHGALFSSPLQVCVGLSANFWPIQHY